jgi:hypothetical protein
MALKKKRKRENKKEKHTPFSPSLVFGLSVGSWPS